jgi:hypothetical protein
MNQFIIATMLMMENQIGDEGFKDDDADIC